MIHGLANILGAGSSNHITTRTIGGAGDTNPSPRIPGVCVIAALMGGGRWKPRARFYETTPGDIPARA